MAEPRVDRPPAYTLYAPHPTLMIVDRDFPDHWKTKLLRRLVGDHGPLGVIRLWGHCEARRTDTFLISPEALAAITDIPAEPELIERALVECRWICREGDSVRVLGWSERNCNLLARIENGKKGGRPRKPTATGNDPADNLPVSGRLFCDEPAANLPVSDKRRGEESRVEPEDSPAAAAQERESVISETWTFISQIFGKKKRAIPYLVRDLLDRELQVGALPLSADQREILGWFYGLDPDPKTVELRSRFDDAARLAENLMTAISRAEAYAKKIGHAQKKEAPPEPPGWREAMAAEFPGGEIPATYAEFTQLGASIRQPVLDRLARGGDA